MAAPRDILVIGGGIAGLSAAAALSSHAKVTVLEANGFRVPGEHRQFVLPIAFHKRLTYEAATRRIEKALSRAGLTRVFGSPVTVVAERCAS